MRRTFPYTLKGNHCRIAATAPASKAYVVTGTVVDPIGAFTQALMESFTTPEACISIGDNRVTTTSLFEFLQREIAQSDRGGVQKPTIEGSLTETLFEYRAVPRLRAEYSHWADEKTAYAKIVVICRALSEENFQSLFALHRYLVRKYSRSFQTLFKQDDGTFVYVPVSHAVVGRYLGFMRRLNLLQDEKIQLSSRGTLIARNWESRGNQLLLDAADAYLIERGMTQNDLIGAARRVLQNRRIPTKDEVADNLSLTNYRLSKSDIGILLDLLAYAGALRVAEKRAYFPW